MNNSVDPEVSRFVLSFDFEIGWGDVTNGQWRVRENKNVYTRLRPVLDDLLRHMDSLEFSATWAVVGAMITPPTEVDLDHLPNKAARVVRSSLKDSKPESFDGRDLFERLISSDVKHSIASHSYSHVPFDYEGVDSQFVSRDIELSMMSLKRYGIKSDRLVFPENTEGFYKELQKAGINCVRVSAEKQQNSRAGYLFSALTQAPPFSRDLPGESGVIRHQGSMLFNMGAGRYHRLPFVYLRALRGLKCISNSAGTMHIWAHPFNFAESTLQLNAFKSLLTKVARARDTGSLVIMPM